jgi:hypothetical protein
VLVEILHEPQYLDELKNRIRDEYRPAAGRQLIRAVKDFSDNVIGREESRIKFPHEWRAPCDEKALGRKRERRKIAAFGNANADKARRIGVR